MFMFYYSEEVMYALAVQSNRFAATNSRFHEALLSKNFRNIPKVSERFAYRSPDYFFHTYAVGPVMNFLGAFGLARRI